MGDVTTGRDVDRGWAWVVLPAAALSLALEQAFQASVGIFQVEFLDTFSGTQGFVAFIGSVSICGGMVLGPVAGMLSNVLSHRATIMVGGAIRAGALFSASFSPDLNTLLLLFGFMAAFGTGLCFVPCATIVSTYFVKYRTVANGVTFGSLGVGFLVGPYIFRWLIDNYGWRYAMAANAGLMAQTCLLASLFFPRIPPTSLTKVCCCQILQRKKQPPHTSITAQQPVPHSHSSANSNHIKLLTSSHYHTEQEILLASSSRTDPSIKLSSRTTTVEHIPPESRKRSIEQEPEADVSKVVVAVSRTDDVEVESWSRTGQEVSGRGSSSDVLVEAGSKVELQSLSMSNVTEGGCGSVVRTASVECLEEQEELESAAPRSFRERLVRLLCQKFIWVMCFNQMMVVSAYAINIVLFPAFARSVGVASSNIPALYIVYGVVISASRITGGFVFSAIPERLVHALFGLQMATAVVLVLLPVYAVSLPAMFVSVVLIGVTYGPAFLLSNLVVIHNVPLSMLPTASGLITLFMGVTFVWAPTVAGITYDAFQSYSVTYYIAGSTVAVGALPLLLLLFVQSFQPPKGQGRS